MWPEATLALRRLSVKLQRPMSHHMSDIQLRSSVAVIRGYAVATDEIHSRVSASDIQSWISLEHYIHHTHTKTRREQVLVTAMV